MARSVAEYYSKNYTLCSVEDSFLSSWQGLAYCSHLTQLVAFPIQALVFYLIVYKTPKTMNSVKRPLLMAHFWCTILDFTLGTLGTPYVFFPASAMFGVGILNHFRVPMWFQVGLGMLIIMAMSLSLIYLFESRSSSIRDNKFRLTKPKHRKLYYVFNYTAQLPLVLLLLKLPKDQELAKLEVLKFIPCPTREFFTAPVFVLLSDPFWTKFIAIYALPILGFVNTCQVLFYIACLIYYLYIVPSFSASSRTRKLQRQFFMGVLVQTGVPLFLLVCTYAVLMVSYLTDHLTQAQMNLSIVIFGVHGIAESFVIIMVHESYRKEVRRIFGVENGKELDSRVQVSMVNSVVWRSTFRK